MNGGDGNAADAAGNGALRPLRTRRPFTPRDPQRTLFADRTRRRDPRPPSAFSLKYLSLAESGEESNEAGAEAVTNGLLLTEPQTKARKKADLVRGKSQAQDGAWAGTRLPHLSGRSKPLHRRNTDHSFGEELSTTTSVTKSMGIIDQEIAATSGPNEDVFTKNGAKTSETYIDRRKQYAGAKAASQELERARTLLGEVPVRQLAVQLPHATPTDGIDRWPTSYILYSSMILAFESTNCRMRVR
ncbi:hypothetical protein EVAR_102177_1 [Eumeta japonica]|uniref:Uncharacterized protein n=1 Tax=Eumeta variegata TaxID=151549 RepID=A0A4C1ZAP8_EUMVA|nr:hypothetical protein EVAR_102177_1 [Eumeta japonica]